MIFLFCPFRPSVVPVAALTLQCNVRHPHSGGNRYCNGFASPLGTGSICGYVCGQLCRALVPDCLVLEQGEILRRAAHRVDAPTCRGYGIHRALPFRGRDKQTFLRRLVETPVLSCQVSATSSTANGYHLSIVHCSGRDFTDTQLLSSKNVLHRRGPRKSCSHVLRD